MSPQTLEHDGLAGDSLVLAVRGAGYEPEQVVLEITERTDARKELLIPEAARLRSLGFNLALDDVGAGNAGLEMLRALPVDFIKIDRAVVANAVADRGARAVMLAIMAFARESGSFVIAEGIETEAMLELARDPEPEGEVRPAGAHGAQGFLLGRPAPVPSESPRYDATLQTLTELTADRERRRIAAALQRGDELYRVLLRTVPDLIVALFDRDLLLPGHRRRHGLDRHVARDARRARRSWKRSATTPTPSASTRCCARCSRASRPTSSSSAAAAACTSPCRPCRCATTAPA